MKKVYSIFFLFALALTASAQVNVTYQVDITDYLTAGNTLGANGIRIGGNFAATGGMNGATAMVDWTPSDVNSAMTEVTDDVWTITVTYPTTSIGMEQQYKFVNNDWGTNEGTDAENTIGADGCGSDDGAGNVNRLLTIPGQDIGYQFCWDHCTRCDGSAPAFTPAAINDITIFNNALVSPNPVQNVTSFSYTLTSAQNITVEVYDMMGNLMATVLNNASQPSGYNIVIFDASDLTAGNYIYMFRAGSKVSSGTFSKQ